MVYHLAGNSESRIKEVEIQYNEIWKMFFDVVGAYFSSKRNIFNLNPSKIHLEKVKIGLSRLEQLANQVPQDETKISSEIEELGTKMKKFLENPKKY